MSIAADHTLIIEAGCAESQYWRDLWRYRELACFLALRDILVRYKQTVIGVAWSVVRPVLTMVVLTWVFSRGARLHTPDPAIPYALWVFVATLPWQFFADGLTASANSLVANSNMISKIYFPRLLMPFSRVLVSFVDFAIAFVVLLGMMVFSHLHSGFVPSWHMVFLPLFLLLAWGAATGAGLWFAALNVKYRDFTYIVPFLVTFGVYVSPVGMDSATITHGNQLVRELYSLNPMVGVIDGFRWAVFGDTVAPLFWPGLLISCVSVGVLLYSGIRFFRRFERSFADII